MRFPSSCDTFVVLPPCTRSGNVIFGKNSDRPLGEVQEVVYIKGGQRNGKLKCTYITLDENTDPVNSVILSKPAWMWGAESGANNKNVVIGNEAVWTNNNEGDGDASPRRLLGMDLLRLGLERGNTAEEALDVMTVLLEKHGQGGPCAEGDDSLIYHNSFLIADPFSAWILETSGKLWAAEKIEDGYKNISNGLTITTNIDKHSSGLLEKAILMGLWDGESEFNFTKCFTAGGDVARQKAGMKLLRSGTEANCFEVNDMFDVLRNKDSNICMGCDGSFCTQGSQVSSLSSNGASVHWFTGTADPSMSYFKPFVFSANAKISELTKSPITPNREHYLYKEHWSRVLKNPEGRKLASILRDMEAKDMVAVTKVLNNTEVPVEFDNLMLDAVEAELKVYK